jgi:transcriptional regulator with XRE-family HTH domain
MVQMAEILIIARASVSRLESGARHPNPEKLAAWAAALPRQPGGCAALWRADPPLSASTRALSLAPSHA